MKTLSNFYRLSFLSLVLLLSFSCTEDEDDSVRPSASPQTSTVSIADSLVSFEASGAVNFTFNGKIDYVISNQYPTKYLSISSSQVDINGKMWGINFIQNSNDSVFLPEPGVYNIIQGYSNTIGTSSFSARLFNNSVNYGGNINDINGTLTVVSNDEGILKAKFSFEALNDSAEKVTVSNGEFSAAKYSW